MHSLSLRRPLTQGDANALLRSALGVALALVTIWLYWSLQFRL